MTSIEDLVRNDPLARDYATKAERLNPYALIGRFLSQEPDGIPEAIKLLQRHGFKVLPPKR